MGDISERRVARRFTMSLPLRVLAREPRNSELRVQTRDVSYQGLYFLAEEPFEVGSEIDGNKFPVASCPGTASHPRRMALGRGHNRLRA